MTGSRRVGKKAVDRMSQKSDVFKLKPKNEFEVIYIIEYHSLIVLK
jgi:hypothetical protein